MNTLASQSVNITTNGYVEVHKRNTTGQPEYVYSNNPVTSAKIKKTTVKGATHYLYLGSKIKGLKTTRVGKKGAYQYRLALKNLHKPQTISSNNEDSGASSLASLYSLGGVTYYTPIGTTGNTFGSDSQIY
ncbi:hypothetical protein LOSG293_350130 [Secundilactobacillus oryzae JCM 18671]|uniref:Uncharacterized protein n=1 Tax=Secundilactobacillus oryzae JCM 18671 TaxID=1291743 RepID=A0A081BKF6_9LACO|nr:hypothetical protein [Secundilactobacillus oryzae]GAK48524.1 hypothetical protein LOSG293_350130 [Secundilactobacillus oryzae JCM 18671]